jgi:low temperature requirement protein LtrA
MKLTIDALYGRAVGEANDDGQANTHEPHDGAVLTMTSHLPKMSGRDVDEDHRVSTPLELLFDLTFATAFAVVAQQLSHWLSQGDVAAAFLSSAISMLAICWAWMSYSWFASAYDTNDWAFRTATMIHMVGVIVLALGVPQLFRSIEEGSGLDLTTMVFGYIIMRVVMIGLWLRAAKDDPLRRRVLTAQATVVLMAQALWTILILFKPPLRAALGLLVTLGCVEVLGPVLLYRKWGAPPWHAHHIAERYSLLVMIALGECVTGAVAMVNATVQLHGWSVDPILIGTACVGLAFGCWWIYFSNPFGNALKNRRDRAFEWGYLHLLIFSSIVAMGAGLQIAARYVTRQSRISATVTLAVTALAVGVYVSSVFLVNYLSTFRWRKLYSVLWAGAIAVLAGSLAMAEIGLPLPVCLGVLTMAPFVVIIGHEFSGSNMRLAKKV